jgi:hypothetical protein
MLYMSSGGSEAKVTRAQRQWQDVRPIRSSVAVNGGGKKGNSLIFD